MGNIFMLQPLLVGEFFGVAAFARVLGALQLLTQIACGLGPFAVGLAFERFGGLSGADRDALGAGGRGGVVLLA